MNAKQRIALVVGTGLLALIGGFVVGPQIITSARTLINGPQSIVAESNWANQGSTVAEMAAQADLIVRVRVVKSETRELRQMLPQYAEDAKTITRYVEFAAPYTYHQMQVLEIYKGSAEDIITVGQAGALPETVAADVTAFSFLGDPIYTSGGEHILFLFDATEGSVHDVGKLYGTVNPFGRYELKDGVLITPGDLMAGREIIPSGLPTSLDELVDQIKQSVLVKN